MSRRGASERPCVLEYFSRWMEGEVQTQFISLRIQSEVRQRRRERGGGRRDGELQDEFSRAIEKPQISIIAGGKMRLSIPRAWCAICFRRGRVRNVKNHCSSGWSSRTHEACLRFASGPDLRGAGKCIFLVPLGTYLFGQGAEGGKRGKQEG